ncbi:hypothetical protein CRUP_020047 [Coryphaenoides rupestris]|nr:hypothetical protein CRUP_020047 [Coryphaenoides rupestris]
MSSIKRPAAALDVLRNLPRVSLENLRPEAGSKLKEKQRGRGRYGGNRSGRGHKVRIQRGPQYQPLSLKRLQYLIDVGRLDPRQPIDLTQLVNARALTVQPLKRDFGVQLVDEGAELFSAKINIEVQRASEAAIAAVERNGGVLTNSFYDPISLGILIKPVAFFQRGQPIPRRMLPGEDMVPYYTDPAARGYLAHAEQVHQARLDLAQRYGYVLPDLSRDQLFHMLSSRKDPRQIFFGLSPGWVVNMADKKILKPTDEKILRYYGS